MNLSQTTHAAADQPLRLAYLMSQYPAVSHTFFLREVLGLRSLGIEIHTASINRPQPSLFADKTSPEVPEAANTFYVKPQNKPSEIVPALFTILFTLVFHPAVFLRGIAAALRLRPQRSGGTLLALFYFAEAMLLAKWLRKKNLSHLHIHFATQVATVGCIAAAAANIPVSLTVHGSDEFFDAHLFALPQKIAQASFILCISDFCRSQLMCLSAPQHWSKMHIVRLGVDLEEFAPAPPPQPNSCCGPTRLLCVGRLVAAKGHRILLESIAQLCAQGLNLHLTLAGDGPLRANLEDFVAQNSLQSVVRFAGSCTRAQTRALLAQTDLFVLSSFAEGVPVALMEAMAMELPCISTQIAGIPELIHSDLDGLLVPPSNVAALTSAIERLVADPELRRNFGRAARAAISRSYNLDLNLRRLAQIFHQNIQRDRV